MYHPQKAILPKVVLVLFVIAWFVEIHCTLNQGNYLIYPRTFNLILLGFYYWLTVNSKRRNIFFVFLASVILMHSIFALNHYSISGMLLLSLSRILLLFLFFNINKSVEREHLIPITFLFTIAMSIILFFFYKDTVLFYASGLATFFLVLLLSVSLTSLSNLKNFKGNLYFFLANLLFLLSDTFLGSQKVESINQKYVIFISSFYYIGYFLIIQFLKETSKKTIQR